MGWRHRPKFHPAEGNGPAHCPQAPPHHAPSRHAPGQQDAASCGVAVDRARRPHRWSLSGLHHQAGADASGTGPNTPNRAVTVQVSNRLQIRLPHPLGFVVGVAHVVTHLPRLPTKVAFSAHGQEFLHFLPRGPENHLPNRGSSPQVHFTKGSFQGAPSMLPLAPRKRNGGRTPMGLASRN